MTRADGHREAAPVRHVQQLIEDALDASGLTYSRHPGAHGGLPGLIVELPGERKLKTNTILSIGEHSVRIEAFVCRKPDEDHQAVYRFLLKRNRRLYGVAIAQGVVDPGGTAKLRAKRPATGAFHRHAYVDSLA